MHKRIWSFILTVGLMLALTPDTVMAANAERTQAVIRETTVQEEQAAPAPQPETKKKQAVLPAAVPSDLEGSGTVTDPYRIKDASQLRRFADAVNGVNGAPNTGICAVLTQNIDLSGVCGTDTGSWTPIGTNTNPYRGTFDGASFAVSGLYCQKPGASYAGLFASNAGIIKNLGVAGGTVSAGNYAGGLCGINKGTITGCYSAASVNGGKYTGGICGCNDSGATVSVCYNTGTVTGSKYVGGICGYNKNAASDCYNTGTVIGSGTSIGGICGYNKKLVSGCYNTGEVGGGTNYVGSVCGYNHSGSTFVNCYYLVTGTEIGNYGVGMTQQQFASGEVCWALNEGNGGSVVWRQTCGTGLPAFGGKAVYRTQTYKGDGSAVFAYTNDGNKKAVTYTAPAPYTAPTYTGSVESTGENSGEHTHVYQEPKWDWKKYESAKAVLTCQDCGEEFVLKASIKKEVTEPTCTEDGETVYTASVERDGITYKDKRVVEKERTGHAYVDIIGQTAATCETPEYKTACLKCLTCGKYFDRLTKKEISKTTVEGAKPLKHDYPTTPTWQSWKMDATTPVITATFTCRRPTCQKTVAVAATVTYTDTKKPDCETPGERTYTATVTFEGSQHPATPIKVEIPAIGHSLKLEPDGSQYKCTRCGKFVSLSNAPGKTVGMDSLKDGSAAAKDAPEDKKATENETQKPDETVPGAEEPPLPPDPEETPEAPTSPDKSSDTDTSDKSGDTDTPGAPDESGGTDAPNTPDESDGTDAPNTPDESGSTNTLGTSDESDGTNAPGTPDVAGDANTPDITDTSHGTDVPNTSGGTGGADTPDIPDNSDSTEGLFLPNTTDEWNETGIDAIEENAVAFRTTPAVNGSVQAAAKQQRIPLWGMAVLLTLLTGVVLLIILRGKHD